MKNIFKKFVLLTFIFTVSVIFVSCSASNSEGNEVKIKVDVTDRTVVDETDLDIKEEDLSERTIMFYIIGSDLEENSMSATGCISEVCKIKNPKGVNYIFMTGGCQKENIEFVRKEEEYIDLYSDYFKIDWSINQIWEARDGLKEVEANFGTENMTDEKTLEKFLRYVKKNYPSKKYDIIFSDHGGAGLYSFGIDTRYLEEDNAITLRDLDNAFKNANIKFDMVGFDACLMASFELMNVISPYANYLVAAEETSFGDWDYSFLNMINENPGIDARDVGIRIVDDFMDKTDIIANSIGVYLLNGFKENISEKLTAFARNMNEYLSTDNYLIGLYDILRATMGLGYLNINDVRDLRDFLYWIDDLENSEFKIELKQSALDLWDAISDYVIYYRTHKPKNEDGSEKTGGVNFVFPVENVYYSDSDDEDNAILSIKNYPTSLNEEYRLMFQLAFLRKSLVKELVYNTFENDDLEVIASLNSLCDRAYARYRIPKNYIDNIKTNIVPMLAGNRLKSGDDGNISFMRNVSNNEITFDLKFNEDIAWLLYTPNATARTYDVDGKTLSLGQVPVPRIETATGGVASWKITPEEDRWFTVKSGEIEYLAEFVLTDYDDLNENESLNYLFDRPIKGFIPAVILRYENDDPEENIIQIHVEFNGKNKEASIIGFTRYDHLSNMSAKDLEDFRKGDVIKLIANFEDFDTTKNISYISYDEIDTSTIKISRGYLDSQSVYFAYNAEDIYGGKYNFDILNEFAFQIPEEDDICFHATFPSTWDDAKADVDGNSIITSSYIGKHKESIRINMYDITDDKHYNSLHMNEELSDDMIDYLIEDSSFDEVYDCFDGQLPHINNESLPILNLVGLDKKNNIVSLKYVIYERDDKKYLIEASSSIEENSKNAVTYHDLRLIKTIQELVNNISEKEDDVVTVPISVKK